MTVSTYEIIQVEKTKNTTMELQKLHSKSLQTKLIAEQLIVWTK